MNIKGLYMNIFKNLFLLGALMGAPQLLSMDVVNPADFNQKSQSPQNDLIIFKGNDPRYKNTAFIAFEKAKIKAYLNQLLRAIPHAIESADPIYTKKEALAILAESFQLFIGNGKSTPVAGYLDILETLEKSLATNNNLQSLAGRLCELERAIALAKAGNKIIEFGPQIKISQSDRVNFKKRNNAYLLMDIDIYAQTKDGKPILEEVKSYKYCSDQAEKELRELICGMHILQKNYGLSCRLHTKYAFKKPMKEFCTAQNVEHTCDLPSHKMEKPNDLQRPQFDQDPLLINEEDFIIIKRENCIVCYPKIKDNCIEFIRDLENASLNYLESIIPYCEIEGNLKKTIQGILPLAREKLSGIPGFLDCSLRTLIDQAEKNVFEKKNDYDMLRSTAFELLCALDVPENKKVIALGAEFFFNPEKGPADAPTFEKEGDSYLRTSNKPTGNDLDVLLQDKEKPNCYSFIEATTGRIDIKPFEKFRPMGHFLEAEVYVFHSFFDNQTFKRTAYLKHPVVVELESGLKLAQLPWDIACRMNSCVQRLNENKNIYKPLSLTLNKDTFIKAYASICAQFKQENGIIPYEYWSFPSKEELYANLTSLLKTIDEVNKKANKDSYKGRIKAKISELIVREKEKGSIGTCACTVVLLQQLNCTMPCELQERYIPAKNRCAIDLNTALGESLHEAINEQIETEPRTQEIALKTIDPQTPQTIRNSNNTTPEKE